MNDSNKREDIRCTSVIIMLIVDVKETAVPPRSCRAPCSSPWHNLMAQHII